MRYQLTKSPQAVWQPLGGKSADSVLFINYDLTQTVFVDKQPGVDSTDGIPVPPLASIPLDPTHGWWAVGPAAAPGTVAYTMVGLTSWDPGVVLQQQALNAAGLMKDTTGTAINSTLGIPAQTTDINAVKTTLGTPAQTVDVTTTGPTAITGGKKLVDLNTTLGIPAQTTDIGALHAAGKTVAADVALTGVPLLRKAANILNKTGQTLLGGANTHQGPFTITQPSWQMWVSIQSGLATIPFLRVGIQWSDSATGQITSYDQMYMAGGNASAAIVFGNGPVKGDTLDIWLLNLDATVSLTWGFTVTQHSSVHVTDDWQQYTLPSVNGYSNPTTDFLAGLVFATSGSINFGASVIRLLPFYFGSITGYLSTGAASPGLIEFSYPIGTSQVAVITPTSVYPAGANTQSNFETSLGKANMVVQITNTSGTTNGVFASGGIVKRMRA